MKSQLRTHHIDRPIRFPLSTASPAARDAYLQGCEAKLTMYPGAIDALDRAIFADPSFALAHAAKAHALLERGDGAAARAAMGAANSVTAGLSPRETSHIAFFDLLVTGEAEAALTALFAHLNDWPLDVVSGGLLLILSGLKSATVLHRTREQKMHAETEEEWNPSTSPKSLPGPRSNGSPRSGPS